MMMSLAEPVGEMLLVRIAREVLERQDGRPPGDGAVRPTSPGDAPGPRPLASGTIA